MSTEFDQLISDLQEEFLFLDSSDRMSEWASAHIREVRGFIAYYDKLATQINSIPDGNPLLEIMPATARLRNILGGSPLPTSGYYCTGEGRELFFRGVDRVKGPMFMGQNLLKKEVDTSVDFKQYGVMTPSMPTEIDALTFGTVGHLLERAFFSWAESQGKIPSGGWRKDDLLHAMNEIVLVYISLGAYEGTPAEYFLKVNSEGGLGWLKPAVVSKFSREFWKLYS